MFLLLNYAFTIYARTVTHIGNKRNAYRVLVVIPVGKRPL